MRQLVTIRTVSALHPIAGADRIELAQIDGWQCVVKKGEFSIGAEGVFFEIDSILNSQDPRFSFLEPRKWRIKSMKLKGALSQGLLMPLSTITLEERAAYVAGEDLAKVLGVILYEVPVPIRGKQRGTFPSHLIPKTDQERIQNIPSILDGRRTGEFEITEKLDGTSCTIWYHNQPGILTHQDGLQIQGYRNPYIGVASRNWEMEKSDDNVYAKMLKENDLERRLIELDRNIAIQGEIIGPAIQGNRYARAKQELYIFDIYDIDAKRYLYPTERIKLIDKLGLKHVPSLGYLFQSGPPKLYDPNWTPESDRLDLDKVLEMADGRSVINPNIEREGIVFKHHGFHDGSPHPQSFKVISNKWLLKYE